MNTKQTILENQGFIVLGHVDPTKVPKAGEVLYYDGDQVVVIGEATKEEYIKQTNRFFPLIDTRIISETKFIKIVAE